MTDRDELLGHADSLDQQANWIEEALAPETPDSQRIGIEDIDIDELRGASDLFRRLASSDGGVKVRELEWEDADEGMCTKWRACAIGGHYELVALDGDGGGLAVNFYWGRPLSFWFIQGEPDEWGPTGPKMFPTLDAAKAAAQADYEQRIKSALVFAECK